MHTGTGSHEPPPGHADALASSNHDVIENPHANQAQRITKLLGDGSVCCAGFCDTARMVVGEDGSAGVDVQGSPDDFPRVNARAVDGASEELLAVEDSVAIVQPHDVELLVKQCAEAHAEEVGGVPWIADTALAFKLGFQDAFGGSENILLGGLAGELVAAFAVAGEAHVLSPRRWIAPWAPGSEAGKGWQHLEQAPRAKRKAGTQWTRESLRKPTAKQA